VATSSLVETAGVLNSKPALAGPVTAPTQQYSVQSAAAIASMAFGLATPWAVALVIKRQPTTGTQKANEMLICNSTGASFVGWQIIAGSGNGNKITVKISGASGNYTVYGSTVLVAGTPYVILVTYDGSSSAAGIQIYINGVAETMTVVTNTATGAVTNGVLNIGGGASANQYDADNFFEAAVMNAVPSTQNRANLFTYLRQKYAAY
jgi:hypothetical protein